MPSHKDIQKTHDQQKVLIGNMLKIFRTINKTEKNKTKIWSIEQTNNSKLTDFSIEKDEKHALIFGNEVKVFQILPLNYLMMF